MLEHVFLLPLLAGMIVMFVPVQFGRAGLIIGAILHMAVTLLAWTGRLEPATSGYFCMAPEGMLVLLVTSFIFMLISVYTVSYMKESELKNEPVFLGCMLLFLATMSMVALADHVIVLWVAIEATTLVSAPLILLSRSASALEATWKYVMICSVGIALALLGSFFIVLSMDLGGVRAPLTFSALAAAAQRLDPVWLKAGFIFVMIGYGTKMGLAPMHTWLPDAHSQAPSPASALLSGVLLNCAFLGVFKVHVLMQAAGLGGYSSNVLIGFGLLSMLIAGVFIRNQQDYKRLLGYSSIENMGVIAFGIGVGGLASYGAMLHLIHHSLIKSSLFLTAGSIMLGYKTKLVSQVGNMVSLMPKTFTAFFAGFVGVSGFPPFGIFLSEVLIIIGAFRAGRHLAAGFFIFCLILVFAAASQLVMRMSFGGKEENVHPREKIMLVAPSLILLLTSIALCIWMPGDLHDTIQNAIAATGAIIHG